MFSVFSVVQSFDSELLFFVFFVLSCFVSALPSLNPLPLHDAPEPRDWKMPLDQIDARDPPMIVARNIAREIAALIAPGSGESVEDEETRGRRPIRPGDVMILVRSRGPFFESVIRATEPTP